MKRFMYTLTAAFGLIAGFSITAHAANALDPTDGSLDLARTIYQAFAGGHAAYAAALALCLAVALTRKYLGARFQWMHTDAGSAALVLLGSYGATAASMLAGGGPLTTSVVWSAACVAFGAAGGYTALKKLVVEPLAPRLPPWLQGPVLWLFQHASDQSTGNMAQSPGVPTGDEKPHA